MWRYLLLFVSAFSSVAGNPKEYSIYATKPIYVGASIGFGPHGGTLTGSLTLRDVPSSFITNQLALLTDEQFPLWNTYMDELSSEASTTEFWSMDLWSGAVTADSNAHLEGSGMLSSYLALFNDHFAFSYKVPKSQKGTRIHVVILFTEKSEISTVHGSLSLDWTQENGNYLQFQYIGLDSVLRSISAMLSIFAIFYFFQFMAFRWKFVTLMHVGYILMFAFMVCFLVSWQLAVDIESKSGDRTSMWSYWIPGVLGKGFDVLEVLLYLLVSLGYQIMRPTLQINEIQLIAAGAGLSLLLGVLEIHCGEDQEVCGGYTSVRMVIHMFGYLTAIMAFNYHLAFLTIHLGEQSIGAYDTSKLYQRLNSYKWFRIIFFGFIAQPTLAVFVRSDLLDWQDDWLFMGFYWSSKIFLMCAIAVAFRPFPESMTIVDVAVKERHRQLEQRSA